MILHKLKSNHGESISEVLVASLIISLAAVILATMILTSVRLINRAQNDYFAEIDQAYISITGDTDMLDGADYINIVAGNDSAKPYIISAVKVTGKD